MFSTRLDNVTCEVSMDEIIGLFIFLATVAVSIAIGFRLGYRYRDNRSIQRQKKYEATKLQTYAPEGFSDHSSDFGSEHDLSNHRE